MIFCRIVCAGRARLSGGAGKRRPDCHKLLLIPSAANESEHRVLSPPPPPPGGRADACYCYWISCDCNVLSVFFFKRKSIFSPKVFRGQTEPTANDRYRKHTYAHRWNNSRCPNYFRATHVTIINLTHTHTRVLAPKFNSRGRSVSLKIGFYNEHTETYEWRVFFFTILTRTRLLLFFIHSNSNIYIYRS